MDLFTGNTPWIRGAGTLRRFNIVIIGGGFVGAEIASAARSLGRNRISARPRRPACHVADSVDPRRRGTDLGHGGGPVCCGRHDRFVTSTGSRGPPV